MKRGSTLTIYRRLGLEREKGIYRIDQKQKGTHGWNVAVIWKKTYYSKFFADTKYDGDPVKSFEAAVDFRNKLERQIGKPHTTRKVFGHSKGIRRRTKGETEVFEVSWCPEENKVARTSVSIQKYGVREAKSLAEKIRTDKWLESLDLDDRERRRQKRIIETKSVSKRR